jgi:hypothetical protein
MGLYGDENFGMFPMSIAGDGLLIFRPEPCDDSFLDVCKSLLFVLPLRHTSGQSRAFDHNPTIFRLVERYMKDHADMLPIATRVDNAGCFAAICRWSAAERNPNWPPTRFLT